MDDIIDTVSNLIRNAPDEFLIEGFVQAVKNNEHDIALIILTELALRDLEDMFSV